MRLVLAFAALISTFAGAAEARVVVQRYYIEQQASAPTPLTAKEYDRALTFYRVHGYWRDGGAHGGWTRGERLPLSVDAPTIDWRANDLFPPRDGYRWTRVGDDFLLVSRTGRMINEIVLAPVPVRGTIPAAAAKPAKRNYVTTIKRPEPVNYEK